MNYQCQVAPADEVIDCQSAAPTGDLGVAIVAAVAKWAGAKGVQGMVRFVETHGTVYVVGIPEGIDTVL